MCVYCFPEPKKQLRVCSVYRMAVRQHNLSSFLMFFIHMLLPLISTLPFASFLLFSFLFPNALNVKQALESPA
jgi:hypothetical protein